MGNGSYHVFGRSNPVRTIPPSRVRPDSAQSKGDLVYDLQGRAHRLVQRMGSSQGTPVYAVRNLSRATYGSGPLAPPLKLLEAAQVRGPKASSVSLEGGQSLNLSKSLSESFCESFGESLATTVSSLPDNLLPVAGPVLVHTGSGLRMAHFDGSTTEDGQLDCRVGPNQRIWADPVDVVPDSLSQPGRLVRHSDGKLYRLVQRSWDPASQRLTCHVRNLNRAPFEGGLPLLEVAASHLRLL